MSAIEAKPTQAQFLHDLASPVNVILGHVLALEGDPDLNESSGRSVDAIRQATDQLCALLRGARHG